MNLHYLNGHSLERQSLFKQKFLVLTGDVENSYKLQTTRTGKVSEFPFPGMPIFDFRTIQTCIIEPNTFLKQLVNR